MANARVTTNLGLTLPGDDTTNTPWGASIHLLTQAVEKMDELFVDHPIAVERRKRGVVPAAESASVDATPAKEREVDSHAAGGKKSHK